MATWTKRETKKHGVRYHLVDRKNNKFGVMPGITTDKEADKYVNLYEARLTFGELGVVDTTKRFDEFKNEILKYYKERTPKGEDGSTYQKYLYAFKSLEAYYSPLFLNQIKIDTIEKWQAHCLKPAKPKLKPGQPEPEAPEGGWGQGLHPTTVYMHYRHLKAAWNKAIDKKQATENPFTKADKPIVEHHEIKPLADEHVARLFAVARESEAEDAELMAALFVGCGLRRQELTHLVWQYINLDTGEMLLKSWDKLKDKPYYDGFTLKKHQARTAYIPAELLPALKVQKARSTSELVFPSPKSGGVRDEGSIDRLFNKLYKRAGIPEVKGVHVLRHTFGFRKGAVTDAKTLQELMGHKNIATTQIYMHTNEERKRAAMNSGPRLEIGEKQEQVSDGGLTVV